MAELVISSVVSSLVEGLAWEIAANYAISTATFELIISAGGYLTSLAASYLSRSLFGGVSENFYGPRLSDLVVQSSADGASLPIPYGTIRLAGNVIWSTGLEETANTTSTSSGGGSGDSSSSSTTTYSYKTDVAIAICEGPITGIRKIWADSKLIYDVSTAEASLDSSLNGAGVVKSFKVYTGTESQLPDPLMESILGADNVPGYRGIAYIVAEDLQLEDYGNRVPNFTFEVVKVGSYSINFEESDNDSIDTESPLVFHTGIGFSKTSSEIIGTSILSLHGEDTAQVYYSKYTYNGDKIIQLSRDNVTEDFIRGNNGFFNIISYYRRANYDESGLMLVDKNDVIDGNDGYYYYGSLNGIKTKISLNNYDRDLEPKNGLFAKLGSKFVWVSSPVSYSIPSGKDVQIITYGMPFQVLQLPVYSDPYVISISLSKNYIHLVVSDTINSHHIMRMDFYGVVDKYEAISKTIYDGAFTALDDNEVLIGSSPLKLYEYEGNTYQDLFDITIGGFGVGLNQWDKPFKISDDTFLVGSGEALTYLNPTGFIKGRTFIGNKLNSAREDLDIIMDSLLSNVIDNSKYDVSTLVGEKVRGYAIKGPMTVKEAINGLSIAHQFSLFEEDGILRIRKNNIVYPVDIILREYFGSKEI